ncbi:MltR family transcriptional regulator [Motilimonas pumila]|uniref:MltR family transcriptional regulator n=1 Tax=Motilimonas pumila TaxID=2303987 RepID=A0A418YKU6_9GAMM|nr:MltR family transcriptional regulator [Motilimonas pumila]RJG51608.1 MltR family transcriptional regulator [Motilimonas pumila]
MTEQQDTDLLQQLYDATSLRSFTLMTVTAIEQAVDGLINRVFRKDDFMVKSVVGPLLDSSGPLGDLSIRLKVLFSLGAIDIKVYQDIELLTQLKDFLNQSSNEFQFTDQEIVKKIASLNCICDMTLSSLELANPDDDSDRALYEMQLARQQQIIKSALILAIEQLCQGLAKDSPF